MSATAELQMYRACGKLTVPLIASCCAAGQALSDVRVGTGRQGWQSEGDFSEGKVTRSLVRPSGGFGRAASCAKR